MNAIATPTPSPPGRRRRTLARRRQSGFTLLELIIVIAIIGILATIAMPALRPVPQRTQEAVLKTNLRTIRETLDQYYGDKGHYPSSLEELVDEGYLRHIPIDPMTKSAETWEVEYEELDPDAPPAETDLPEDQAPGIFDVHSGSDRVSLDGVPYSEW
jgi:general secretion pathway protein G